MKAIQVRNVPEQVHTRLQSRADQAGQSMQEYLLELLTKHVEKPTMQEWLDRAREIREQFGPIDITREQIVEDIHAAREERDAGWD
jgi:plasmid stability protein